MQEIFKEINTFDNISSVDNHYLSADKQNELVLKSQNNDIEARNTIIKTSQLLVVSVAKKYLNNGIEFLDLIQYGNLGLNKAIDGFDFYKETKFSTYALKVIESYIKRAISKYSNSIKLPLRFFNNMKLVLFVEQKLIQEKMREIITDNEIQNELFNLYNLSISIEDIKLLRKYSQKELSLNNYINKNNEILDDEILNTIESSDESVENKVLNNIHYNTIRNIIYGNIESRLTKQEREILYLRFGFDGSNQERNREQVAKLTHVSRERVRQVELNALRKLRKMDIINENEKTIVKK